MLYTLKELSCKDTISTCDGKNLGRICDLELDGDCGRMTAVYVALPGTFWEPKEEVRIPWDRVKCIGEDAVLVDWRREECRCEGHRGDGCRTYGRKRKKEGFWQW